MDNNIKKFFGDFKPGKIYSYSEFMEYSVDIVENTNVELLGEKGKKNYEYSKINLHRSNRIHKTFKPNEKLIEKVKKISEPQFWLAITEDWCGDSAQNLPYIVKYLEFNPLVNFRIILRDENIGAIDQFFKSGNPRSIPKIVGFGKDGLELFIWGPRPKFAQDLVAQLKSEGYTKEEFNKELHLWYGRNRGKELENELNNLLNSLVNKKTL